MNQAYFILGRVLRYGTLITAFNMSLPLGADPLPEYFDARALDAARQFEREFDLYERKAQQSSQAKIFTRWDSLVSQQKQAELESLRQESALLKSAIGQYQRVLASSQTQSTTPHLLLKLAEAFDRLGQLENEQTGDLQAAQRHFEQAVEYLQTIESSFQSFAGRDRSLFLLANLYERLDQKAKAISIWRRLQGRTRPSAATFYARIVLADKAFEDNRPEAALRLYNQALSMSMQGSLDVSTTERVRLHYRIAWSAFRSNKLNASLKALTEIFRPGQTYERESVLELLRSDAISLAQEALIESKDIDGTIAYLAQTELKVYGAQLGRAILASIYLRGRYAQTVELGSWLIDSFPLSEVFGDLLLLTAQAEEKLGNAQAQIARLTQLAYMLPKDSLWKMTHKDNSDTLSTLHKRAVVSAQKVAAHHYQEGLARASRRDYEKARELYDLLVEETEPGSQHTAWRMRSAHCSYLLEDLPRAALAYDALRKERQLSKEALKIINYQRAKTQEKIWRKALSQSLSRGADPKQDQQVSGALQELGQVTLDYVARFPDDKRSIELVLMTASAHRDSSDLTGALQFWQKSLLLPSVTWQRSVAIRGIVYALTQTADADTLVKNVSSMLQLEDWRKLGKSLQKELTSVLEAAVRTRADALFEEGRFQESGDMLVHYSHHFPGFNSRSKMYRDGIYMFGLDHDWAQVKKHVDSYVELGLKKHLGDITYIDARAHEFLLQFPTAIKLYLQLAKAFPRHKRVRTGLMRAQFLADADQRVLDAAKTAMVLAKRSKRRKQKIGHYKQAVLHFRQAQDLSQAQAAADMLSKQTQTPSEQLKADILQAELKLEQGQSQPAERLLETVLLKTQSLQNRLSKTDKALYTAEASFLLGEIFQKRFHNNPLSMTHPEYEQTLDRKNELFQQLVVHFDRASAQGQPDLATHARYLLASTADAFAEELKGLPQQQGGMRLSLAERLRYDSNVERLKSLSKRYFSLNLRQRPHSLLNSETPALTQKRRPAQTWRRRSSQRLHAEAGESSLLAADAQNTSRDELPLVTEYPSTMSWLL